MHVYELVVNQISATNGSLWVTNSAKCESVNAVIYVTTDVDKIKANCYYVYSPSSDSSVRVCIHTSSLFNEDQFEIEYQNNYAKDGNRMEYIYKIIIDDGGYIQELTFINFSSDMSKILNAELVINYNSDNSKKIN